MSKIEVYDKVSWHYPEGNCPNLESARKHFVKIMDWLAEHNLLSDEGKEILAIGIDSDFSLTSSMLTASGNELLRHGYSDWIKGIDMDSEIDMEFWDKLIAYK